LKKYIITTAALLIVMIGAVYLVINKGHFGGVSKTNGHITVTKTEEKAAKTEMKKEFETATPKGKMPDYENMSENELIQEVHGMTHQKVKAEQKWGSSQITKDKVLKLYDVVKNKDFKDQNAKDMLLEILKPWTQGDFSNAVTAHNMIWKYQDGTVGEATRLLTASEEKDYIKHNF
jgi:preprotein translocase subunit SecF